MMTHRAALLLFLLMAALAIVKAGAVTGQDPLPAAPVPTAGGPQAAPGGSPGAPLPQSMGGVEVLSRGPVHEAFATPTTEPVPTPALDKRPPATIEEIAARRQAGWQRHLDTGLLGLGRRSQGLPLGQRHVADAAPGQTLGGGLLERRQPASGAGCLASGPSARPRPTARIR